MSEKEGAKRLLWDLITGMKRRTFNDDAPSPDATSSSQKKMYGDSWSLAFGITRGCALMEDSLDEWLQNYDEYGYGAYGNGLKIGRELATYTGRDFSLKEPEKSVEREFTFVE